MVKTGVHPLVVGDFLGTNVDAIMAKELANVVAHDAARTARAKTLLADALRGIISQVQSELPTIQGVLID